MEVDIRLPSCFVALGLGCLLWLAGGGVGSLRVVGGGLLEEEGVGWLLKTGGLGSLR